MLDGAAKAKRIALRLGKPPTGYARPVARIDEQPVQRVGEARVPIPATRHYPERVDYEYQRHGTASLFVFAEPLAGFRQVTARARRTKMDWAHEVAHLLDTRYSKCLKVTLVRDNLNTTHEGRVP